MQPQEQIPQGNITQVQILTPAGHLTTEGEIMGTLFVADLSPFTERNTPMWGVGHLGTGWGIAAFRDEEIARAFCSSICEEDWDSIYARVNAGVHMDDMPELPMLLEIFNRSLHDSHSIIPLACAPYTPSEIVEWVENHHRGIMGEQN